MMKIYNKIKSYELKKQRHNIKESYDNKKEIIYCSWDENVSSCGNLKENDILYIIKKLYNDGIIKWYIHEPNGKQTFPDLRIWFNDSKNCIIDSTLTQEEQEKYKNDLYVYLGNDYVDFEIKTYKLIKNKNALVNHLSNSYIHNIKELDIIDLYKYFYSFNIYIGYSLLDLNKENNIIKNGILKTETINICPGIYNINYKKQKNNKINLTKINQDILNKDVYPGYYLKVKELIYKFINLFYKKE